MKIHFYKYQGTGNDFIMIDNRDGFLTPDNFNSRNIIELCDRRFGIGADGLIIIQHPSGSFGEGVDFRMRYFNSDGSEGAMCGNGGRCAVAFAYHCGAVKKGATNTKFTAVDGMHEAFISDGEEFIVKLKMIDVDEIRKHNDYFYLDTGAPHYVRFVPNVDDFDVFTEGRKIRYADEFQPKGTNANFVEVLPDGIKVRTYERGVEDETYSCGTGSVASALCAFLEGELTTVDSCKVKVLGGNLKIEFEQTAKNQFKNIWLEGPASYVFEGDLWLKP